ncbi:MAG: zinc-dependent alcohol dehydrogenase [Candidatus Sericytochromatia bacterium]
MKAIAYHGRRDMRVDDVPDPRIEEPTDVVLRITATAICGSDLHMYNGFMMPFMKPGDIMGHEFMGVVEEVGGAVSTLKVGDRVIIPFLISCGHCFFCDKQLYACCENTNPDPGASAMHNDIRPPAAMYGYTHLYGGVPGGQAQWVRVRNADVNAFKIPDGVTDEQVLFLTDILPTGYQAIVQGNVGEGSTVAIFGAGPVGQMAALSARLKGASTIYVIDDEPYRLAFAAEQYGAIPINFKEEDDVSARLIKDNDRRGVDCVVDAVGFEAKGNLIDTAMRAMLIEQGSGTVLRHGIAGLRRGGTLSIPGVYAGFVHGFPIGDSFDRGHTYAMGQTHVHRFVDELLGHIVSGRIHPETLITHRLTIDDGPNGYKLFADKHDHCRKVVLYPHGLPAA